MPLLWRKQAPVSCGEIQLKARPEPDIIKKTGEKAASMKRYIKDYDAETPIEMHFLYFWIINLLLLSCS